MELWATPKKPASGRQLRPLLDLALGTLEKYGIQNIRVSSHAKQLPQDCLHRYGYRPLMLETFVEQALFTGGYCRAANWRHVGQIKGQGVNLAQLVR